jgi:tripartite-type tricarboxylate transporter receptor subunit TctC
MAMPNINRIWDRPVKILNAGGSISMKTYVFLTALLLAAWSTAAPAQEASWPTNPVRLVLPYPAGSSGDLIARRVLPLIVQKLGGRFFIDDHAGANGNLGMKAVKDSTPDGYTFAIASDIQFAVSPVVYAKLPYDADKDFIAVAPLARMPNVLVAPVSLEANNLRELIALAKAKPGKLAYASVGPGSTHQLNMELLKLKGGFDMLHVPYKGTSQATPDLINGQVQSMFFGVPQALAMVKSGQLKVLAVGTPQRLSELPDVPTIAESGFPGFEAISYWGVWAPTGTPSAIIARLRGAIMQGLEDKAVRDWYRISGIFTVDGGADAMMKALRERREIWRETVKAAKIELIQ